jgi:outer membrane receptor protein involved in Fe transport
MLILRPRHTRLGARAFVVFLLLVWTRPSAAQFQTGTLIGGIVDGATKQPIAAAVVTASATDPQVEQFVVTDETGAYRVPNLPPGSYIVRVDAPGYRSVSREDISLNAGSTLRVELQLVLEEHEGDEMTVIGQAPSVDVGSARSGLTIDEEFTSRIAVASPSGKGGGSRSFEQLAELAPTGRGDLYGGSLAGTTSPENVYIIDGMSVSDPGFGYNATPLSIDFVKQTGIITGGYLPEYGRGGGGVLEVVTKSGSNEVHGSVFGNLTPWQASPRYLPPQDSVSTVSRLTSTRDIGFDVGGPIVKDKAWFYFGLDYGIQNYSLTRDLNTFRVDPSTGRYLRDDAGLILSDRIPGTRRVDVAQQNAFQYLGKLTWSPSADDRVELIHRGTPTRSGGDGRYTISYETGVPYTPGLSSSPQLGPYSARGGRTIFDSFGTSLKWTHTTFGKRLTFDTSIGWQYQHSADLAPDGSSIGGGGLSGIHQFVNTRTGPPHSVTDFERIDDPQLCVNPVADGDVRCAVARYYRGGPGGLDEYKYHTYQGRELVTWLASGLGQHVIKAGVDFTYFDLNSASARSAGSIYTENAGGTAVSSSWYGAQRAPDDPYLLDAQRFRVGSLSVGSFLQDSWSIADTVTVNAGLRYDTQTMYAEQGIGLSLPNQWSPRVGAIWDPTQDGRAKLFANYAIYYQSIPLDILTRGGSGEATVQSRRRLANCDPSSASYPQSCDDPQNLVRNPNNNTAGPNDTWYTGIAGRTVVDPDIKPQSSSEFSGGGEIEVIPNGRLGLTYIHRSMNNIIEDMSRDEGVTLFFGNPGEGIARDFPRAVRNYDAGVLHFTKGFSHGWLAQASYTLSHLRGNWDGLFRPQTGQIDPGGNADWDLRSLLVNRTGDLSGDRRHEIKLFGAKDVPLTPEHRLSLGASYFARSGGPTNVLGQHRLYGRGEVFVLPRGDGDRLPWTHSIDLHVAYTFVQAKRQTFAVTLDVFNLFNFQQVVNVNQIYTYRAVEPLTGPNAKSPYVNGDRRNIDPTFLHATDLDSNPKPFSASDRNVAFGSPAAYQTPITVRVGIKSTF